MYLFRHGAGMLSAWGWQPGLVGPGLAPLGQPLHGSKLAAARASEVTRVSGVGFGWTLISRETLERIPLRLEPSEDWAPDVPFALDCLRANILQVAHFGVLCGHWDGVRWRGPLGCQVVDGVWVRARRNMVTIIAGEKLELIAGNEYAVPAADVSMLERREFAERIPGR